MKTYGRIWKLIKPHTPVIIVSTVILSLVGLIEGLIMLMIKPIFDNVLQKNVNTPPPSKFKFLYDIFHLYGDKILINIALALLILTLIKSIGNFSSNYLIIRTGQKIIRDLRFKIYSHLLNQSVLFFHNRSSGEIISNVVNDVDKLQNAFSRTIADFIRQFFSFVALLMVIFYIDPLLSTLSLVIVPTVALLTNYLGKKVKKHTAKSQEILGKITSILQETIIGNRIIKIFSMERFERNKFKKILSNFYHVNMKNGFISSINPPIMEILAILIFVPFLIYAHFQINKGYLSIGTFTAFFASLLRMYDPVRKISRMHIDFQQAVACSERIFNLLDTKIEVKEPENAFELPKFSKNITFENVSFKYGENETWSLKNINIEIKKGEKIGIVGSSGSGKTTLVNLIPRFFDPTEGYVKIDGVDIKGVKIKSLRRQISMVTQETFLFKDSIKNNIRYGKWDATDEEIKLAAQKAFAHEFIEKLKDKYDTVIGERGETLSGGEKQRIAIARAILKNAPILILDEATSSLDSESEKKVQLALNNLMKDKTAIVIAHRLSTIKSSDRILILDRGEIKGEGRHEKLIRENHIYKKLYKIQFEHKGEENHD